MGKAHELEKLRGTAPSGHAPTIENETKYIKGDQTQPKTEAQDLIYVLFLTPTLYYYSLYNNKSAKLF